MNAAQLAVSTSVRRVFKTYKPPPFDEWLFTKYRTSKKNSHADGPFKYSRIQANIAIVFADLDTPEVNMIKGTQLGFSHVANAFAIYEVTERGRSIINYLPRGEDADFYSGTMLVGALEVMPEAASKLVVEDPTKKDASNTNKKRTFEDGNIFSRNAESPSSYDMVSASTVMADENSRHPAKVKRKNSEEEGESPYDKRKSRMDAAKYPNHISYSSPESLGACATTDLYNESDLQLEEFIPCPCCSTYIPIDFGDKQKSHGVIWDKVLNPDGSRNTNKTAKTARYLCPACHDEFTHEQLIVADNQGGELRNSENTIRLDPADREYKDVTTGEILEKPYSVGIRVPSLFSRYKSLAAGTKQYLDAVDDIKTGDNSKMQAFVKKYLAKAYEHEASVKSVKHEFLMARYETYAAECPQEVLGIVGWWDIQDHYIQGLYAGFGLGEEMWVLKSMIRMGDVQTSNVLDVLGEMKQYEFTKPDGSTMDVLLQGVDCGYRGNEVYTASKKWGRIKVIPTMGQSQYGKPWIQFPQEPKVNCQKTFMTMIGSDRLKDLVYGRYRVEDRGPGFIHIPEPTEENGITEEWCKQAVAENKIQKSGTMKWEKWRDRNEALDCLVGCTAMIKIAQLPQYGLNLKQRTPNTANGIPHSVDPSIVTQKPKKRSWSAFA